MSEEEVDTLVEPNSIFDKEGGCTLDGDDNLWLYKKKSRRLDGVDSGTLNGEVSSLDWNESGTLNEDKGVDRNDVGTLGMENGCTFDGDGSSELLKENVCRLY